MTSQDKRAPSAPRARVELDIDLGTYDKYFLSKLENVSTGGAFVKSLQLYPVGTVVNIRFRLPSDRNLIQTQAEVIWTYDQAGVSEQNSSGMGIKFIDIQDKDRDRIANFVAKAVRS